MPRDVCRFVKRDLTHCGKPAVVSIPYGMDAIGACSPHVGPVLLWAMNASRTERPSRAMVVIPTHMWDDYPSLHEGL